MRPLPRTGSAEAKPVVARPAVIISQPVQVGEPDRPRRPPSTRQAPASAVRPTAPTARPPTAPAQRPVGQEGPPGRSGPRVVNQGPSMFGAGLITERSLDEVILSYLAEDIDGGGDDE